MARSSRQVINSITKHLRTEVPPAFKVRVHLKEFKDPRDFGDCSFSEKGKKSYFLIRLNKNMDPDMILFVLVHEWAHAVAWTSPRQDYIRHHDAEWGVAYARCCKAVSGCQ